MTARGAAIVARSCRSSERITDNGADGPCHRIFRWQRTAAAYLLKRGADVNWFGYDDLTPLDAARREGADELIEWLRSL
jgi:hypothetical protein